MTRIDYNETWDKKGKLISRKEVTVSDEEIAKEEIINNVKKIPKATLESSILGKAILDILRFLDLRDD